MAKENSKTGPFNAVAQGDVENARRYLDQKGDFINFILKDQLGETTNNINNVAERLSKTDFKNDAIKVMLDNFSSEELKTLADPGRPPNFLGFKMGKVSGIVIDKLLWEKHLEPILQSIESEELSNKNSSPSKLNL